MKTILSNKKNILEKLTKVFGGGTYMKLRIRTNGQLLEEYTSVDFFTFFFEILKNKNSLI